METKSYAIKNALIVTPTEVLKGKVLLTDGATIAALVDQADWTPSPDQQVIDAEGAWLMPGFIDIHADYIEHMAAPRPSSLMDFRLALREAEKELVTHGVTTMFHSLSFYKTSEFGDNPVRNSKNVRRFIDLIDQMHQGPHLVRHRFHARLEIDNPGALADLEEFIRNRKVHLLSFMDHTPGQGQYRNLEIFRETLKGYRNLADHEVDAIIDKHQTKEVLSLEVLTSLARTALDHGVAVASHDDDTVDKVKLVKSLGATISEFPITLEVAREAQAQGLATVAGAPNILLGGSHSGNLSAAEAIQAGVIDILCSDYYPAALLHGVFRMVKDYGQTLPAMVALVSSHPAQATGLGEITGAIRPGLRADLLLCRELEDGFPVVEAVFVDGVLVHQTSYRRSR